MPATYPSCERGNCKVQETFVQATRTEPMRSLGFQGYCPDCDLPFITESEGVLWLRAGAPDAGPA